MHDAFPPGSRSKTSSMPHELITAPGGQLALVETSADQEKAAELSQALVAAFASSPAHGLLHLATRELQARLTPGLEYARSYASAYLAQLCHLQGFEATRELPATAPPSEAELTTWVLQAPPLTGLEYLSPEALTHWW